MLLLGLSIMTIPTTDQFSVHFSKWFAWYPRKLIDFLFTKIRSSSSAEDEGTCSPMNGKIQTWHSDL